MLNTRFYMLQRLSALVMAPLTLGHLAIMIYAIQGGLSTAEILGRTQGSTVWFLYYAIFVSAVSIHGAIGLRVIVSETIRLRGVVLEVFTWGLCLMFLTLGGRAVYAVTVL